MKNILFRADSSSLIGTGHIMRDLVLAEQFKGAHIVFATQDLDGNINYKIKEKNYTIEILSSNNIENINILIKKLDINMIVIDHYDIDYSFEKKLKVQNPKLKIFSLDDTYEKHYCDILLNHNIYAIADKYKGLVPDHCELRCGVNFTLIRDEFIRIKKNLKVVSNSKLTKLFIAMGGADHSNINLSILRAIACFKDIEIDIITTSANRYLTKLTSYVRTQKNIVLHINTDKMALLLLSSDIAIVSPSVTLNEVFYLGKKFIAIKTADNQIEMYNYLIENAYPVLEFFDEKKLQKTLERLIYG